MMPSIASAHVKGSTPRSSRRTIVSGALFVWRVESTRWPVSEASMPMAAVSWSRISPTMMTSGSARRKARRAAANVKPILGWTWTCRSPSCVISTGSSAVQIFRAGLLRRSSSAWRVVVLPDPVGPTQRMSP